MCYYSSVNDDAENLNFTWVDRAFKIRLVTLFQRWKIIICARCRRYWHPQLYVCSENFLPKKIITIFQGLFDSRPERAYSVESSWDPNPMFVWNEVCLIRVSVGKTDQRSSVSKLNIFEFISCFYKEFYLDINF